MSKQCCPKPNVITFEDGTGHCQSCRTEYSGGEPVREDLITVEERTSLQQQLDEIRDGISTELASLNSRVTALEQGPPVP